MDYKSKENLFIRLNDAASDLAKTRIAERNNQSEDLIKHSRDAGEALSQALELAMKFHLKKHLNAIEQRFFRFDKVNIHDLIGKYIDNSGNEGDYYYSTINDSIEPTVNFKFLKENKGKITNESKHKGSEPNFEIQQKYYEEVKKFFNEYVDNKINLKNIEDFENVDFGNWDLFYNSCDRFVVEERNYILIIGPNLVENREHLNLLSLCKWDLIIDFDYHSMKSGFFKSAYTEVSIAPHSIKAADHVANNTFSLYKQSHYHYFANNYEGSGYPSPRDYNEWTRMYSKNTEQLISSFADVFQNQKTIVVILYPEFRYVNNLCEKITQNFGDSAAFVIANDSERNLAPIKEYFGAIDSGISISEIATGIKHFSTNFGVNSVSSDHYELPFLSSSETKDVTGILSKEEMAILEEDFEVFHLGLPEPGSDENRREFLSGEKRISPFGLKNRFDVERQNFTRKYIKPIEKLIEKGRGKVFLKHEAGFGGSTIARRIAWEIHTEYPTLILKKFRENKVKEQIFRLHQKTRKTSFIIVEIPQAITLDDFESLFKTIPITRPVVFLIVKRGKPGNNDLSVPDWGNDVSDLIVNYAPYLEEYPSASVKTRKLRELNSIPTSIDSYKKTPFYIGLLAFNENFFAIKEYINNFVVEVNNKALQRDALIYLSLIYDYLGQALPATFFRGMFEFTADQKEIFYLEHFFNESTSIVNSLLTSKFEGKQKYWYLRHAFLAKELKKQLLSGGSENPETWKHELARYCIKFIEDSVAEGINSEYIEELLQKLFIGNRKDRAGDDFTPIINDIPTIDDKETVFVTLKKAYPTNPHYCSHLARFYAYNNKNYGKALEYADEAIQLSEAAGVDDPLLHHIKGMCLRAIAYDMMEQQMKIKRVGKPMDNKVYEDVIYNFIPKAEYEFRLSREIIQKDNKIDAYGYVAHIQMLIRGLDYGFNMSGVTKTQFISENKEPFADWLDLVDSLLEDVKGMNQDNDESGKIEECENDLEAIYENYETILQNLRNQLSKSSNPSRTRRQIVRTYMKRSADYSKDIKIVDNILDLLQQNIENEPDNHKNFFLWFQTARFSRVNIENALAKLSKWKAQSSAIDAVFYLYILKVFRALDGYSDAAIEAVKLIKECQSKARSNITIYEWYGKGENLIKLVNRKVINDENKNEKLDYVSGFFTEYHHDGSGVLTIADTLKVFVSPTQAKLTSSDLNKKVIFFLGFSYDGLRADSYSVRITG